MARYGNCQTESIPLLFCSQYLKAKPVLQRVFIFSAVKVVFGLLKHLVAVRSHPARVCMHGLGIKNTRKEGERRRRHLDPPPHPS